MKRQLVLASHGNLSSGMISALQIIFGFDESIIALNCFMTENFDLKREVQKLLDDYANDELIVVTDIFGGSVNNMFMEHIIQPNFYLISGMNLPFLIELLGKIKDNESTDLLIEKSLISSKESIQFCNKVIHEFCEEEDF